VKVWCMDGCANPSSCTGQLDRELPTAQHSHQRIELRDARDAVRQPELRSQFVRGEKDRLGGSDSSSGGGGWVGSGGGGDYCNN